MSAGFPGTNTPSGTGVSVARFATLVDDGLSAREMHDEVFAVALSMAQIHAALACYYENRATIDAWLDEQAADYDIRASAASSLAPPPPRSL